MRHARLDGGVYVHRALPAGGTAPVMDAYLHTQDHAARGLVWQLVADALAGSHVGRALTGGSNDPAAVLDALVSACDDLIRLRHHRDYPSRYTTR